VFKITFRCKAVVGGYTTKLVCVHKEPWKVEIFAPMIRRLLFLSSVLLTCSAYSHTQELPYFVTYSHHMEEPGSLEIESKAATGRPDGGNRFVGNAVEFEYGTRAWWTTEFYTELQSTAHENTFFTGFRIENRIRPLLEEHKINPVIYVEFEDINGANKSLLEVVGHDGKEDVAAGNRESRGEKQREAELKLILSSNAKGWNFSENIIAEKNLAHEPWEFGYALAASRPLRLKGGTSSSAFALQNFIAGVELYGGLGDKDSFGTSRTSHYFGPTMNWNIPDGPTLSFSPNFGLNDFSVERIYRVGVSYEIGQLSRFFRAGDGGAR
jgi:hypothetical protein